MRRVNLNALRAFDAAARHLNFRLAAEELNITQGAVAQQVRRLEADLGFRLFHRLARGVALTNVGYRYHKSIRRALATIDQATLKLKPESSRITLSVPPSFASKWLVPRLGHFSKDHPEIELSVIANERLANFQSDGVDLAIRIGEPPFGDGLQSQLLAPLSLCAVCSQSLAESVGTINQLEDFAEHPLIQDSHNLWDSLFDSEGVERLGRMVQFNQTALAMEAAASGQGIALAPRVLLDTDFEHDRLVELWQVPQSDLSGFYVVCPNKPNAKPAVAVAIDWIFFEMEDHRGEN